MAQPNIVGVDTIRGETVGYAVTTSETAGLTNSTTHSVYKVNSVLVANVDGTNDADIDVRFFDDDDGVSGTNYYIAKGVTVPAKATLDLLNKPIYLEESDSLKFTASAASDLEAVISYEIIIQTP